MLIKNFLVTEKAMIELEKNLIIAVVNIKARKEDIKKEFEKLFNVEVEKVNVLITPKGEKKAFIKLKSDYSAEELLSKLGVF
ncbi:MAG: 50S ribosomal protein L23 [Archaeoglobaceae archaeon]|nr:50S ribosomal protein L23 [Archaeoglobaceae archaeon]MDW7989636.1 50S ribosomal protein L23 [Archaeoglobaceae archaeon]